MGTTTRKAATKRYDMSARDAAERLDVNPETLKRKARRGEIPARKDMSGFWRFNTDDLDAVPVRSVTEPAA